MHARAVTVAITVVHTLSGSIVYSYLFLLFLFLHQYITSIVVVDFATDYYNYITLLLLYYNCYYNCYSFVSFL